MFWLRALVVVAGSVAAANAFAHHGIANFDLNKDVAIRGTVTKLAFVNPHSWLYVSVVGADGRATEWQCEMRAATVLRRSGWSEAMFTAGTAVSVTGSPDRNAPNTCYLGSITFADGTSMDRYGQRQKAAVAAAVDRPERLPNGDPNLNGDWAGEQRVMTDRRGISGALVPISVADRLAPGAVPEGGRAFPGARGTPESLAENAIAVAWSRPSPVALTDAGRAAAEGFDPSSADNPRLRCEPTNILFDWGFETFTNRITQDENAIRIQYGAPGIDRTIHLNETAASGRHRAERCGPLDRALGERRADRRHRRFQAGRVVGGHEHDAQRSLACRRTVLARSCNGSVAARVRRRRSVVFHRRLSRRRHGVRRRPAVRDAELQRFELCDGSGHGCSGAATEAAPAEAVAPAKPWWMFWK